MLVDVFAHQIHADGGADGGNIVSAQKLHHIRQRFQHVFFRNNDLGMVGTDVVCHLFGVFQIDGIDVHADGKGFDGFG